MLVTFLLHTDEDQPVFFNFRNSEKEFEKNVLFSLDTGFPSQEMLASAILDLENFKSTTLSYIAELEGEEPDDE